MIRKSRTGLLLAAVTTGLLGAFIWHASRTIDAGSWQPLAGAPNFYTRIDYEGRTSLGYRNYWWQQPEMIAGGFYNFRLAKQQVVGYDEENASYVAVDAAASSSTEAEASMVSSRGIPKTEN